MSLFAQTERLKLVPGVEPRTKTLTLWHASVAQVWLGLYAPDEITPLDSVGLAGVLSAHLEVYSDNHEDADLLIEAEVEALNFNYLLSNTDWNNGTDATVKFQLSAEQLNQPVTTVARYHYVIWLSDATSRYVISSGDFVLRRNQAGFGGTPPAVEGGYYTKPQVDELLAGSGGNGTRVFANDAARALATPNFTGQFGYQTDIGLNFASRSTTPGDWVITGDVRYVRTEAELVAAVATGGKIGVVGHIALTAALSVSQPYTEIFGVRTPTGTGKLSRAYLLGAYRTVVNINAHHVRLRDLEITANQALADNNTTTVCVLLPTDTTTDVSWLHIVDCELYGARYAVERSMVFNAKVSTDILIERTKIYSITWYGIYVRANTPRLSVIDCTLTGRLAGATHRVEGNAIWVGNNANHCNFIRNIISRWGRHGIEYWNSQDVPETTSGNDSGLIEHNHVFDMLNYDGDNSVGGNQSHDNQASFGISAFGAGNGLLRVIGNVVRDCFIGIEIYNDSVNNSRILCAFNQVRNVYDQLISVNACYNTDVCFNFLGPVPQYRAIGVQIIKGAFNVRIFNNIFDNAGLRSIQINGVNDWVIQSVTPQVGTGYAVVVFTGTNYISYNGKWLYMTDWAGLTAFNGKYVKVSQVISQVLSGSTWTITAVLPLDISAMPAWTPGTGKIWERYNLVRIENNTFDRTKDTTPLTVVEPIQPTAFTPNIWIIAAQNVYYRNNVILFKDQIWLNGQSDCVVSNWGTVYAGDFAEAPVEVRNGSAYVYAGSNLRLPLDPVIEL